MKVDGKQILWAENQENVAFEAKFNMRLIEKKTTVFTVNGTEMTQDPSIHQ